MATLPLPTLAAQVTPAGISGPSFQNIQGSFIAGLQAIYGSDTLLTPDTKDLQLLSIISQAVNDTNNLAIAVYNNMSPATGQGAGLSSMVKINGLMRLVASNSTATVTITGVAGTVINAGLVQDTAGNIWSLPPVVTIPGGGSINVLATAQVQGVINAAAGAINIIFTPTQGWQTVTNASAAIPGAPVETDAQLRQRQSVSTGLPAQTPLSAIFAAIANLPGVTRLLVYENQTASTDANGVASHSIAVIVLGGNSTQIAQTIEAKKSPGTGTVGSTSITVNDPSGLPITINFYILTFTQIFVSLTIKALAGYTSAVGNNLIAALVNFINSLPIGNKVYYNWLLAVAQQVPVSGDPTYDITAFTTGTAPSPSGTTDIAIAFNMAAQTQTSQIVLTVT